MQCITRRPGVNGVQQVLEMRRCTVDNSARCNDSYIISVCNSTAIRKAEQQVIYVYDEHGGFEDTALRDPEGNLLVVG